MTKITDMANEFQISSLAELFDSFGDSTLYKLPTAYLLQRWQRCNADNF